MFGAFERRNSDSTVGVSMKCKNILDGMVYQASGGVLFLMNMIKSTLITFIFYSAIEVKLARDEMILLERDPLFWPGSSPT